MAEPCIKKHPIDQDCMPQLNTLDQYCHLRGVEIGWQLVAVKFKLGHKHRTLGRLLRGGSYRTLLQGGECLSLSQFD